MDLNDLECNDGFVYQNIRCIAKLTDTKIQLTNTKDTFTNT